MAKYKVSVSWRVWADLEIEAESPEEAEEIAHDEAVPDGGEYCDGSWEIHSDETELLDDESKH